MGLKLVVWGRVKTLFQNFRLESLSRKPNECSLKGRICPLKQTKKMVRKDNQSVENAGVAFVRGADERNKFFEKINNQ